MKNTFAPEICFNLVAKAFCDEGHPAYGQVATLSESNYPEVRTVHIHYIAEKHAMAINTHTQSSKWLHLKKNPVLSGCYFDEHRQIQFRWNGTVELMDNKTTGEKNFLDSMWLRMRQEVRKAYWMDQKKLALDQPLPKDIDLNHPSSTHGVVICHPIVWNIYELHPEDYSKGAATLHELKNGIWQSKIISILGAP